MMSSDESQFLLHCLDGRLVDGNNMSAGGVCAGKLWGIFSWHTFAPLVDRWITAF